ncbi:hypothetical protein BO70DRAFT_338272 [Aspergillus heteromorphus CBS 117.55]|uniref:Uncharacterized protein n=1 Tax=Aspergillus heteromorphus CBS 117.55 TaxID=1448321 RepID=A0A317VZD3_9EURO|nr:uncharacterized protein BO70DRAFT_338272 [Aspergillus heteromorphus CBS 117.55]PWY79145.1 hypothetical protein BO70DRAFT_338272 [Aspergillus heteromorphus CBS 117.55]
MASHDGLVHYPPAPGALHFGETLIRYLNNHCRQRTLYVHLETRPNSSPHIGNLVTFATGFALAAALKHSCSRNVRVRIIYQDPGPDHHELLTIDGVKYQKGLTGPGDSGLNQTPFRRVIRRLAEFFDVSYDTCSPNFWQHNPEFTDALMECVKYRRFIGTHLSPTTGKLAIRVACPECGLVDKDGVKNGYHPDGRISCDCPQHGMFYINPAVNADVERMELGPPLRHLIRAIICSRDKQASWIMCTGADHAGLYHEELVWRLLDEPEDAPIFFYAPLVVDWSGARLSKTKRVRDGAYQYLCETRREYMVDADMFLRYPGGLEALCREVRGWIDQPYRLFRNYSVEYLERQLRLRGMLHAVH